MSQFCYIVDVSGIPENERHKYYSAVELGSDVITPFDPRLTEFEVYYDEKSSITAPPILPHPCKVRQIK